MNMPRNPRWNREAEKYLTGLMNSHPEALAVRTAAKNRESLDKLVLAMLDTADECLPGVDDAPGVAMLTIAALEIARTGCEYLRGGAMT